LFAEKNDDLSSHRKYRQKSATYFVLSCLRHVGSYDHIFARLARIIDLLAASASDVCQPWLPRHRARHAWLWALEAESRTEAVFKAAQLGIVML